MNPLIDKFEELYGENPEPNEEPTQETTIQSPDGVPYGELTFDHSNSTLMIGNGNTYVPVNTPSDTIKVGDTVIPTAELTPTGINLTGNYITPAYISNGSGITAVNSNTFSYNKTVQVPHQTAAEHQFYKVLKDLENNKATVSAIKAEIDPAFTGFGGQITYTVEIVGRYP